MVALPGQSGEQRLQWLDAARGVAAFAVMCYHYDVFLHLRPLFNSAYLAVDLFFMMSGFVLSHSYEGKLRSDRLTVGRYMVSRAIRLYPTYLVATGVGLAYYVSKIIIRADDAPSVIHLLQILLSNIFFIPVITPALVPHGMFPLAPSSWSLATEVIASILYGLLMARLGKVSILVFTCIFGYIYSTFVIKYSDLDLGWDISNFIPGVFRTLFEFAIGIILYRLSSYLSRTRLLNPAILLATVTGVLVMFTGGIIGSVLFVFVLFPAFLISAEGQFVGSAARSVCHQLGRLSYPVYLLHTPVLLWFAGAYKLIKHEDPFATSSHWLGLAMIMGTVCLSELVAKCIDQPVRAWLNGRLRDNNCFI